MKRMVTGPIPAALLWNVTFSPFLIPQKQAIAKLPFVYIDQSRHLQKMFRDCLSLRNGFNEKIFVKHDKDAAAMPSCRGRLREW